MKHLFEWRWVFGFWCSCRPHSHRNRVSLHKVLSDKLWECEVPTFVWSDYCCGKGTKPFFFLIPPSMQRRLTKQNTHSHFPHISSGGHWKGQSHVTDRQMLWYSAKLFVTIISPIPFVLHKWTYYYNTTCTPWCWKCQSSLGDLKLLQSASSGQNLHSVPLDVRNAIDIFLFYHIIWSKCRTM